MIILPSMPRPPRTAANALPLVEVARITVAPPRVIKFLSWILRLAVDVAPRPELPGQQYLLGPSDRDSLETHLHDELYTQVAVPADAQQRDQIPGHGAVVTERIERRDAGTCQGPASTADSSSRIRARASAGAIM